MTSDLPLVAELDLEKSILNGTVPEGAAVVAGARRRSLMISRLRPGTNLDLIGNFTPDMREAANVSLANVSVYIDSPDTGAHVA